MGAEAGSGQYASARQAICHNRSQHSANSTNNRPRRKLRARNERAFTEIGQIFGKVGLKAVLVQAGRDKTGWFGSQYSAAAN